MKICVLSLLLCVAGVGWAAETNEVVRLDGKTGIDSYSQGKITIGGKPIRTDIVVLPDGTVQQDWNTKVSHVLAEEDIRALLEIQADVLIIGTGNVGMMKPTAELKKLLKEKGIAVLILKTGDAIKKLKALREAGKKVSACFHIGC